MSFDINSNWLWIDSTQYYNCPALVYKSNKRSSNTFELFDVSKACFQCESSWSTVTRESAGLGSWLGIGGRQEDQEGRIAQ